MNDQKNGDGTFLHELQRNGKATGKMEMKNLDEAIKSMAHILNQETADYYKNTDEGEWETGSIVAFCQDCGKIVSLGIKESKRGKTSMVCGICSSKKIARGREEALKKFYRLDEKSDG